MEKKEMGSLIVVSGPSGCGKATVIREVIKKNKNVHVSVSCTSREAREGEVDGKDYYFITKEEFEDRISQGDFLEFAQYVDNYYGTPKSSIQEKLDKGIDVILEIEIQGALKIKEILPQTIFIFLLPPSMRELKRRLEGRGTETKEKILGRFKQAYKEINVINKYNYVVVNDEADKAADKVNAIILSERCRVDRIEDVYLKNIEEEMHEVILESEKEFLNEKIDINNV